MTETTPARTRTWVNRATLAATLLTGLALTVATPATANAAPTRAASTAAGVVTPSTIRGPESLTVSCNAATPKIGVTVTSVRTGQFKIRQNSSSPASKSVVWAVSGSGNSLSAKTISNGQTATWTNVLRARYTVHVHRTVTGDCNGPLPQPGNYNWNYTVTYNG
jgi:hypothetical protein